MASSEEPKLRALTAHRTGQDGPDDFPNAEFWRRMRELIKRELDYTCPDGHQHTGIFRCVWGFEDLPMPLDPSLDLSRIEDVKRVCPGLRVSERVCTQYKGRDFPADTEIVEEYPPEVKCYAKVKYDTVEDYEMHKDELTDFEKEMCEVWFRATDKYKVEWYEFRVKALDQQLRRLQAEWQAIPHDPKRRFTIASEQYWLTVQIREAKKDWSWNLAYSSPLHSILWDDLYDAKSAEELQQVDNACKRHLEVLKASQSRGEPRPHDSRPHATNCISKDIEIFELLRLEFVRLNCKYVSDLHPAAAACQELDRWYWE